MRRYLAYSAMPISQGRLCPSSSAGIRLDCISRATARSGSGAQPDEDTDHQRSAAPMPRGSPLRPTSIPPMRGSGDQSSAPSICRSSISVPAPECAAAWPSISSLGWTAEGVVNPSDVANISARPASNAIACPSRPAQPAPPNPATGRRSGSATFTDTRQQRSAAPRRLASSLPRHHPARTGSGVLSHTRPSALVPSPNRHRPCCSAGAARRELPRPCRRRRRPGFEKPYPREGHKCSSRPPPSISAEIGISAGT